MIITTTSTVDGRKIKEYRGVVFGEVVNGISYYKDFAASFTAAMGGRSKEYEQELVLTRADAINEMISRANQIGANAIVGVKVDYETMGIGDRADMLMIVASGTAVVLE